MTDMIMFRRIDKIAYYWGGRITSFADITLKSVASDPALPPGI
jgi:hypothetical protein